MTDGLVAQTQRLQLRGATLADAAFFVRLLNEPGWLRYIGDRGIRSQAAAETYIEQRVCAQYQAHGYGMYVVELRSSGLPIGICGLVKRDYLPEPDLGFALLAAYAGQGLAYEAAQAVMAHVVSAFGIERLCAIVSQDNHRSIRLLERLGFRHAGAVSTPDGARAELYAAEALA